MSGSRLDLDVPSRFDFRATAYSHGWCVLAPFAWHEDRGVLERTLRLPAGVVRLAFSQPGGRGRPLRVVPARPSSLRFAARERKAIASAAVRMFGLDVELGAFHARCRRAGGSFGRAARAGFGRLLRAPTLFEDLAKVLATTNTTWAGTKSMVAKLVAAAGTRGAFPTPRQIAGLGARRLAAQCRWGYRAQYLDDLARAVVDRRVDLVGWERFSGSTEALEREVRALAGFGPYATAHVLALLGRHDRIGVDTVFRGFVHRKYFAGARKPPADRTLLAVYDDWGAWRGLAYWADLWHEHRIENL